MFSVSVISDFNSGTIVVSTKCLNVAKLNTPDSGNCSSFVKVASNFLVAGFNTVVPAGKVIV